MKHWNKDNFKRLVKRGAAALLCAAAILPLTTTRSEAFDAAEIVSKIDMSGLIYIFKWTPLLDGDKARSGTNYATMLNEKNMVIRGPDRMFSGPDCAQIYVNSNYTPFNYGYRSAGDVFYTIGSMGAPIIHCVNDDTDNNLMPECTYIQKVQTVSYNCHHDGSDQSAEDTCFTSCHTGSADNGSRNNIELVTVACLGHSCLKS